MSPLLLLFPSHMERTWVQKQVPSSPDHVRKLVGSARHNLDNRAVDDDDGEGDYRVLGGREGPTAHTAALSGLKACMDGQRGVHRQGG